MNKKIGGIIATTLTYICSFALGIEIILLDVCFSDVDEFSAFPMFARVIFWILLGLVLCGMIMSSMLRKHNKFTFVELKIDLVILAIGFLSLLTALKREDSFILDIILYLGVPFFFVGLCSSIETFIILLKKDEKIIEKVDEQNKEIEHREITVDKKKSKVFMYILVITSVICVLLVVGGIVGDIVYADYFYKHKDPSTPGHLVPAFSFYGIALAFIISIVMSIVLCVIGTKKNNK